MRSFLRNAVMFGTLALVSVGCRSKSDRTTGQSGKEPYANNPPMQNNPPAQEAPPAGAAKEAPPAGEEKVEPHAIGGGPAEPALKTTPAGAVASIALTRCDRQARCNNIGPNETYKTRVECVSKMQSDDGKSINASACPGGINEGNLNRCLQALREEGCGSPIGALERLESCKTDSICKKWRGGPAARGRSELRFGGLRHSQIPKAPRLPAWLAHNQGLLDVIGILHWHAHINCTLVAHLPGSRWAVLRREPEPVHEIASALNPTLSNAYTSENVRAVVASHRSRLSRRGHFYDLHRPRSSRQEAGIAHLRRGLLARATHRRGAGRAMATAGRQRAE